MGNLTVYKNMSKKTTPKKYKQHYSVTVKHSVPMSDENDGIPHCFTTITGAPKNGNVSGGSLGR